MAAAPSAIVGASAPRTPADDEMPPAPPVEVRYKDVNYTIKLPAVAGKRELPSVARTLTNTFLGPFKAVGNLVTKGKVRPDATTRQLDVLSGVSGVLRPGTLTLVLSPPGHGKSSYLKMIAKQLPKKGFSGTVTYSGSEDGKAEGVHLPQLVQLVGQLDEHLPFLTVRETLSFVHGNATLDPAPYGYPKLAGAHDRQLEGIIDLLHLRGCQDTIVGNDLMRGISGGEKKRVTVGEGLLTNAQVLCLDEPSTGLDSSVTHDIVLSLRKRAQARGMTVVIALLQPTPEVLALFDDVILLREGAVVFHGPRESLPHYLEGLGFHPPAADPTTVAHAADIEAGDGDAAGTGRPHSASDAVGRPHSASTAGTAADGTAIQRAASAHGSGVGGRSDLADWVVEMLTSPAKVYQRDQAALAATAVAGAPAPVVDTIPASVPTTTAALVAAWKASPLYAAQMNAPPSAPHLALQGDWARAQFGHAYAHSWFLHLWLLLKRQFLLMARNPLYLRARVMGAIIMSVVLGGLYWQRSLSEAMTFYGVFLNCSMNLAFGNMQEMASTVSVKYTAYKHISHGNFPSSAFVLAGAIAHVPVSLITTAVFSGIVYGMTGLAPGADRYFFLYFIAVLVDIMFRNVMASFSYIGRTLQAAQAMPMPVIALLILFAGFLVAPNKMGWMTFLWYIDPFGYAVRSLAINEFSAPRYDIPVPPTNVSLGISYLQAFGLQTEVEWKWYGVAFLLGCIVIVMFLSLLAFNCVRFDNNIGSRREKDKDSKEASLKQEGAIPALQGAAAHMPVGTAGAAIMTQLGTVVANQPASPAGGVTTTVVSTTQPVVVLGGPGTTVVVAQMNPALATPAIASTTPTASAAAPAVDASTGAGALSGVVPAPAAPAQQPSASSPSSLGAVSRSLGLQPMAVCFRDISYTVKLPKRAGGGTKTLLHGISGYALPGRMLALMGASGAGKSTLLDVLASRKNSGTASGQIYLNGHPKDPRTFNRITGYVEQESLHMPLATVREAIAFSAALRLPATVTLADRKAFVDEVLQLMELTDVADRIVGQPGAAGALAPAERKRLTIGVELASNAPVIFADEPTSGLDSRAASVVMRVLRRVASSGRTVIATVHAPSAEIFGAFDDVLLLQRGGYCAYVGPLGRGGKKLVRHLTGFPGVPPCPPGMNVSTWMLDVLAGTFVSKASRAAAAAQTAAPVVAAAPLAQVVLSGGDRGELSATGIDTQSADASGLSPLPPSPVGTDSMPSTPALPIPSATAPAPAAVPVAAPAAVVPVAEPQTAADTDPAKAQNVVPDSSMLPGPALQAALLASPAWTAALVMLDQHSKPAPGTEPVRFPSMRARSPPAQLWQLIRRQATAHKRNVALNYGRLLALTVLGLLFGTVWYKAANAKTDQAGVQTLIAAIFFCSAFSAMINLNTAMPPAIQNRPTFYRETSSRMYHPALYWLSSFLVEIPWMAAILLATFPLSYFMLGLSSDAGYFFFNWLCVLVLSLTYWALGTALAAAVPTFEVAQAVGGILLPLFFLFGGMWSPPSQMAPGARWFCWIDPITYAFRAIIPEHFWCQGANCPVVPVITPKGIVPTDTYSYVSNKYEVFFPDRWDNLGFLAIFIVVFGTFGALATTFIRHIVR